MVLVHNPEATGPVPLSDPGLAVPVTPPRDDVTLDCPRGSSTVRANDPGGAESEESKRAKVEEAKKQRINRLQLEYEERLSAVRIAYKEYFTMDGYSTDLDVDDDLCEDDEFWYGEDEVKLGDIPEALWSDAPTDMIPSHAPEAWIDELADQVECNCWLASKCLWCRRLKPIGFPWQNCVKDPSVILCLWVSCCARVTRLVKEAMLLLPCVCKNK